MEVRNQTDEEVDYEVADEPIRDPPPVERKLAEKALLPRNAARRFEGFVGANVIHRAELKISGGIIQVTGPVGLDVELRKLQPEGLAMQFVVPASASGPGDGSY